MSTTYSTSPELHLRIAESRYPHLFLLLFTTLQMAGLWLIARSGAWWWVLAVLVMLAACVTSHCLSRRARPLAHGIHWRRGRWWVECGDSAFEVEPLRWHCQPWCTYIAWRDRDGRRGERWLFRDSAPREELRRLRVRLTLQRRV